MEFLWRLALRDSPPGKLSSERKDILARHIHCFHAPNIVILSFTKLLTNTKFHLIGKTAATAAGQNLQIAAVFSQKLTSHPGSLLAVQVSRRMGDIWT